ncbi:MAG: PilW family protein [Pseudomonadota bacterium]
MKARKYQKGLSIIELMVALLLGLFLVSGVTGMYISSKQTYRMTDNLSRLQENLRFSLELMSKDIRMAGYMPCRYSGDHDYEVINGDTTWFLDFFDYGIQGYEGGASFPSTLPVVGPNPGQRMSNDDDAIAILKGSVYSASIAFNNNTTGRFTLQDTFPTGEFETGDIAIACDPNKATLFQISSSISSTGTPAAGAINYNTNSGIAPGNYTANLQDYGQDAQITKYEPVIYYIARSNNDPTVSSLWRNYYVAENISGTETATMWREELLEGVESMQILYGEDTLNDDQIVDRYVTADNVSDWLNVVTVRLGLLMVTAEEVTAQPDTNTYNVAGTSISDSTPISHPADNKLRYVVNTTINLRNRVR